MTKQIRFFSVFLVIFSGLILQSCQTGRSFPYVPPSMPQQSEAQKAPSTLGDNLSGEDLRAVVSAPQSSERLNPAMQTGRGNFAPVKIGLLLPLSGDNAQLGKAMMNAAQMAAFDLGHENFELLPRDTKGTAQGGANAAYEAIKDGAELLLGPVFAEAVNGARGVANSNNINMIAFTTNWSLAGDNTFVLGFVPFDQVNRILSYATSQGLQNVGALASQGEYGNIAIGAFRSTAQQNGVNTTKVARFRSAYDLPQILSDFTQNTQGGNVHVFPHQAVFMPTNAGEAMAVAEAGFEMGMKSPQVRFLGTGLWDDPALARNTLFNGAWFAAPDPALRSTFEARYVSLYSTRPPRITTLAYDATALAAILAQAGLRYNGQPAFDRNSILNPNGFAGLDGIFRFRSDGIAERGLAVLEFANGRIKVRDPSPATFQK